MSQAPIPALPCFCASLRRATRALTQRYEEALRPTGLRATQFTILQALTITGQITQGDLGHLLVLDSTTLTRTLAIMSRRGWIARRHGDDKREWRFTLSEQGAAAFRRALPYWKRAQRETQRTLGPRRSRELMNFANQIANSFFTGGLQ